MNYNVSLTINGVDYSNYIQVPFQIQETLDETMDVGSMTLNFLNDRTPFKPYSECVITLTQPDNVPLTYTMLLESDFVQEVQHGNSSYWKHNLKFVELTHLLSNYYLSDFTITQPITAFAFPKAVPQITEDSYNQEVYEFYGTGYVIRAELFFNNTAYSIKTKYISPFNLSNSISRSFYIRMTATSGYGGTQYVYYTGNVTYAYYYKLYNNSTWTQIADISNITLANGIYDIKAVMNTVTYHYKDKDGIDQIGTININETILFENIEIASSITEADIFTIKEGVEKVLSVAKLEEIGEDYDFITLNSETVTKFNLDNLKCPEMTITNGRNMLEVLYDIGREFNAYPRLIKNEGYEITFDLLENPEDNSTYEDGDELETEEANMTNYANVLVSNVTNMTSSEQTKTYPGVGRFISCRADPNQILLEESNMCILLDDNINYIVKVVVKNWLTANTSLEQDITGYVYEKTLYEALNNNATGKGLALYYEKGKNKIESLGALPKIQSLLGISATDVIIKEILAAATAYTTSEMADPLTYLYQVEYVPYVDAQIITHQTNNADFDNDYQANYNQETANINAEAFGKSTQKTIGRIGNNNVNTVARVNSISQIPYVGENKVINNEYYYANVVTTTFNNNSITVSIEYSKDFNKINNRVSIDKEYREYSLYANNFVNRTINIQDFCEVVLATEATEFENTYTKLAKLATDYASLFATSTPVYPYEAYKLVCYQTNGTTILQYTPFGGSLTNINEHIIPASLNVLGNSIVFVGSCYDNYSVGQYLGDALAGRHANKDARYVDNVGECPVVKLTLSYANRFFEDTLTDARTFPIATQSNELTDCVFKDRKFRINKDNRERLKFVYSVNFYTRNKLISIHKGAIKYLYSTDDEIDIGNLKLIGYKGDIKNKDVITYESNDILNDISDMTVYGVVPSLIYLKTAAVTPLKNYNGFALVWHNTGELLYSFRYPLTAGVELPSKYIYFNFINKKVDGVGTSSI